MTRLRGDRAAPVSAFPDWDATETYAVFDIVRGPDGATYAATLEAPDGPPPTTGWAAWPSRPSEASAR